MTNKVKVPFSVRWTRALGKNFDSIVASLSNVFVTDEKLDFEIKNAIENNSGLNVNEQVHVLTDIVLALALTLKVKPEKVAKLLTENNTDKRCEFLLNLTLGVVDENAKDETKAEKKETKPKQKKKVAKKVTKKTAKKAKNK